MHWFSPYYRGRLAWKMRNCGKAYRDWAYILEDGVHTFYASQKLVVRQTEETGLRFTSVIFPPKRCSIDLTIGSRSNWARNSCVPDPPRDAEAAAAATASSLAQTRTGRPSTLLETPRTFSSESRPSSSSAKARFGGRKINPQLRAVQLPTIALLQQFTEKFLLRLDRGLDFGDLFFAQAARWCRVCRGCGR